MKRKILKTLSVFALLILGGCVALVFIGCQTRVTWEKHPETAMPVYDVKEVNGVRQLVIVDYRMIGGGFYVTARSPLFAKERFSKFSVGAETNGAFTVTLGDYDRDLSTNAVVMVKTIFDGSANLALAVAKAYAALQTGGSSEAASSIASKVVNYFKSRGGDESKSTVTADSSTGTLTVTDGTTCISCDAAGNCSDCTRTQ